jgi:hypothetical protein
VNLIISGDGVDEKKRISCHLLLLFYEKWSHPRLGLTCPDDPLPEAVLYVVYSLYAVSLIMFLTIGTGERVRRNRHRPYTVKKG